MLSAILIGLGDTLYLTYFQYLNIVPTCALSGCEKVLTSVYSKFLGVPLSYLGLVYYLYFLGLVVLLTCDPTSKGLRWGAFLYASIGLLLSIIFEAIQVFAIGALCQYCAISALVTAVLWGLTVWHLHAVRSRLSDGN